jgi:catechol 2,3-dioxygenase-like lactoylglutathione lyase family enzyme
MHVRGITFVGTRTTARAEMAEFVQDVLGLQPVAGDEAEVFALPDGSSFAVTSPDDDGPERTVGFLVDDVTAAAAELASAGIAIDDEISSGPTLRYLHFRAPDGKLYELVEVIR